MERESRWEVEVGCINPLRPDHTFPSLGRQMRQEGFLNPNEYAEGMVCEREVITVTKVDQRFGVPAP